MLSMQMRRSMNQKVTPDLGRECPVCGNPYRAGEEVLALARVSFGDGATPPAATAAGGDPGSAILLGHHGCVLPRLLTLLAGFQPEVRFVRAAEAFPAGAPVFPEPRTEHS
jgi:hypothetical protein